MLPLLAVRPIPGSNFIQSSRNSCNHKPPKFSGVYFRRYDNLERSVIYHVSTSYALRFHTINCVKPVWLRCASFSPKCNTAFRGSDTLSVLTACALNFEFSRTLMVSGKKAREFRTNKPHPKWMGFWFYLKFGFVALLKGLVNCASYNNILNGKLGAVGGEANVTALNIVGVNKLLN